MRKKMGELDIICRDKETWVCVEVKYRKNSAHGHPLEAVNHTKLTRMIAAFNLYLLDNKLNPAHTPMRFDIVAFDNDELIWLKNVTL
jgi:putative endonuclease